MSDPVSNSEIEDVLASIRRLVSENAKALKGDRTRDPEAEKLVLTPALRIDETDAQAEPADVFAVDTDTWKDVSREAEASESKGIFSHRAQPPEGVSDAADTAPAPDAAAEAPVADAAAPAPVTGDQGAASSDGESAGAPAAAAPAEHDAAAAPGADAPAETESPKPVSAAATALEQRIAELETAMDLRPKTQDAPASDAVSGGSEAAETAATAPEAPAAAAPAADAPPKSWIEGLVAAAAAAEAARLAERNKSREAAAPAAAAAEAAPEGAGAEQAGAADDTGPLELTDAHAVSPEPDSAEATDASDEAQAAEAEDVPEETADAIVAEASQETAEVVSETAEDDAHSTPATETAAQEAATAGPERSWVDRLIAAAATLRDTPEKDETEASAADGVAEAQDAAGEAEAEAEAQPEEDLKAVIEEAAEEAADDAAEADVPLTLEPLNLVDPISSDAETGAQAEADLEPAPETDTVVPEWEEITPPELDAAEEAEEAEAVEEPQVEAEADTVLTGPWTAAAVARDAEMTEETPRDTGEEAAEETGAAEADDVADAAEEVSVGALEWEPVSPPEAPAEAADDAAEETAEDTEGAVEADIDADHEGDIDRDPQDLENQEETEQAFGAEPAEEAADDETDGLDADAAAVAAAVEADVDWEGAGLASAGVAAASAFYDETDSEEAADDAEAAAEAEAETDPGTPRRELVDETVIDEAMLRELVAQIVRDELQGTVGERITHNVRRLIRREIARALTLQDLEK